MDFLVCPPEREYFDFSDPEKHNIEERASERDAKRQHEALRRALVSGGCGIRELAELSGHPNSVFTRDPALVLTEGYIRLRMGLESRRGEEEWIADKLESLGMESVGSVRHGTAEGGDMVRAENTVFVGLSSRTSREGASEVASMLGPLGYDIRKVKVPERYLHLGGAMSYLGRGLLLCTDDIYDKDLFRDFDALIVDSADFVSGNVICAGMAVIADERNLVALEKLNEAGIKTISLDLSEFIKGRGGPSCLVLPLGTRYI
jgi:dimethylargininase